MTPRTEWERVHSGGKEPADKLGRGAAPAAEARDGPQGWSSLGDTPKHLVGSRCRPSPPRPVAGVNRAPADDVYGMGWGQMCSIQRKPEMFPCGTFFMWKEICLCLCPLQSRATGPKPGLLGGGGLHDCCKARSPPARRLACLRHSPGTVLNGMNQDNFKSSFHVSVHRPPGCFRS